MNPIWQCSHVAKKINIFNKDKFQEYVTTLPERIEIIVRAKSTSRTIQQNRYYRKIVSILAKEMGESQDDMHEILKSQSDILRDVLVFKGKTYGVIKSTTSLTTKSMGEYIEEVKRFASIECGVYLPEPGQITD